jgi:cytochrome c-type biogenesis protein CcmH
VTAPVVAPSVASSASAAVVAPRLQVQIGITPALAARIPAGAVLFVFARAPGGPPMPLAVRKLPARLPASVVLTDGMGMAPSMNLSSVPDVVITARISASGQPLPQAGDFEGRSAPVPVRQTTPVAVTIDKVL